MLTERETKYNRLLDSIADGLDIPESKYQQAVERYQKLGEWLCDGLHQDTDIYPQGSIRLGTLVRPVKKCKDADYDIDLVCELPINKIETTPRSIKQVVGDRLIENNEYKNLLDEEGKRCWTLEYKEEDGIGFHVDILPTAQELLTDQTGEVAITHKSENNTYSWLSSNPKGYASWFDERKRVAFQRIVESQKRAIFENSKNKSFYGSIDNIPDWRVKTPLQRAIQILKRHRDLRFAGHQLEEYKPISVIITTLAAHLYEQEEDTYTALKNIIQKLQAHSSLLEFKYVMDDDLSKRGLITRKGDEWEISNPVNPNENFADCWHKNNHARARAFFNWVSWLREDLFDVLQQTNPQNVKTTLSSCFGEQIINEAFPKADFLSTGNTQTLPVNSKPLQVEIKSPSKPWSC